MSRHRLVRGVVAAALLATGLVGTAGQATTSPVSAWVPTLYVSQGSFQQLSAFRDGTAYVFDVGTTTTLWHSSNFGLSWDPLTYLPANVGAGAQARFASAKVGYLISGSNIYMTTDGAKTATSWRQLPGPKVAKGDMIYASRIGVTGSTVAIGGDTTPPVHTGCNPPAHGDIWTSHDSGRTWIDAKLPADVSVGSVRYVSARDGVAWAWDMHPDGNPCEYLGDKSSVWVTHDGGRHFNRVLR
ncbi:MAG: Photosynthesis system assembly factor, partial [Frankiaceae bacterium]|nr:Photosynthesis system assembly factor [Frankiaceae bacterium]